MKITIPDEQAISWNLLYSQGHWTKRSTEANRVHLVVREHIDPNLSPFDVPVDIEIRCYYLTNKRPDSDNVCAKLYIDGLIGWVIVDDNYKYVRNVTVSSRLDRESPRLEIIVTPILRQELGE